MQQCKSNKRLTMFYHWAARWLSHKRETVKTVTSTLADGGVPQIALYASHVSRRLKMNLVLLKIFAIQATLMIPSNTIKEKPVSYFMTCLLHTHSQPCVKLSLSLRSSIIEHWQGLDCRLINGLVFGMWDESCHWLQADSSSVRFPCPTTGTLIALRLILYTAFVESGHVQNWDCFFMQI